MNSEEKTSTKEQPAVITDNQVVSKNGATLEVRVIEVSVEAKRAISDGLKFGKAAAHKAAAAH